MTDETTRIIEFVQDGRHFRVELNAADRITYGQIAPGSSKGSYALRIYEGASKDKTKAVFGDVTGFRDITIPVKQLAVRRFGQETWHADDGHYVGAIEETVEKQWIDIDEVKPGRPPGGGDEDDDIPFSAAKLMRKR